MIIKTFTAESSAAALKQVRAELGRDAVVLKTRELAGPNGASRIEITACLDGAAPTPQPIAPAVNRTSDIRPAAFKTISTEKPINRIASAAKPEVPSDLDLRLTRIEKLVTSLAERSSVSTPIDPFTSIRSILGNADVPQSEIDALIAELSHSAAGAEAIEDIVRASLTTIFESRISPTLTFKPGDRILFAGPAGSGKTSVLGKLAARLVFQDKRKVTLVTVDSAKIGGIEELQSYADILGAQTINHQAAAGLIDTTAITLIDTPSWPRSEEQQKRLHKQIEAISPNYRLVVLPAVMRSSDVADVMAQLNLLSPSQCVVTMLDLTRRWGSVLAVCSPEIKLAFTTNGAAGIGTVNAPDAVALAGQLLCTEVSRG